jgi:predicted transcriptional regulator
LDVPFRVAIVGEHCVKASRTDCKRIAGENEVNAKMKALEARFEPARTTATDVCKKAGVSYSTWYRCLTGENAMRPKTLGKLEKAMKAIEAEREA